MRLVLLYHGRLPSSGNNVDKHIIRQALHPQLKRLWEIEEPLIHLATASEQDANGQAITGLEKIASTFSRGPFRFIPLATKSLHLVCQLDITFLRREDAGQLVRHGGDIDNRLKVLFDSLRIPDLAQVTNLTPTENENPFYCLLEDDALITGFRVTTERLLEPTQKEDMVRLSITAIVRPTKIMAGNMGFLGGWL